MLPFTILLLPFLHQHLDCSFGFLCLLAVWSMDQHISMIWELVRNADSQGFPQTYWVQITIFKFSSWLLIKLKFAKPWVTTSSGPSLLSLLLGPTFKPETRFQEGSFCLSWIIRLITYSEYLSILQCEVQIYVLSAELPLNTYVHFIFLHLHPRGLQLHLAKAPYLLSLTATLPEFVGNASLSPYLKLKV